MNCPNCGIEIKKEYNFCPNCQKLINQNNVFYKEDNIKNVKTINSIENEDNSKKYKKSYLLSKLEIFESILMIVYSTLIIVMPAIAKIILYPFLVIFCAVASAEGGAPDDCTSIELYLSNPFIIIMFLAGVMFLLVNIHIFNQLKGNNNLFNYKIKKIFEHFPLLVFIGIILLVLSVFCVITA